MRVLLAAALLALLEPSYADEAASYQTLTSLDGFGNLIPCARGCIAEYGAWGCGSGEWGDNIAHAIGCDSNCKGTPWGARNSCYCRPDYMPTANSYLSGCVKSRCVVGDYKIDLTSASSLYNGYCNSLGYFMASATVVDSSQTTLSTTGGAVTEMGLTGGAGSATGAGGGPANTASGSGSSTAVVDSSRTTLGTTSEAVTEMGSTGGARSATGTGSGSSPTPQPMDPPDSVSPAVKAVIALGVILCIFITGLACFITWWRATNTNQLSSHHTEEMIVGPGYGGIAAN